jgi:hypothetical protein
MQRSVGRVLMAVTLVGAAPFGANAASYMSGEAIRSLISGKRVYLAGPLGSEVPLTYRAGGGLDGEVPGIIKLVQKSDSGNWWVAGDQMCQKWRNWYDGKIYCFRLTMLGGARFRWHRSDGASGLGRVAN